MPSHPPMVTTDRRSDAALNQLQAKAHYYFQRSVFAQLTQRSAESPSVTMALHRLAKRGRIVAVTRRPSGYLIVPPEHASFGAPPFSWWVHDCMTPVEAHYYVGLLTAAQHWGSAHYARQDVQIMISRPHPSLTPGRLKISFTVKRNLEATPTVMVTSGVAPWRVSTRAATVLDLLRHQTTVGGLESVVRVLRDFVPYIKPAELRTALDALDQRSTAQRLGFLLDRLGHPALAKVTSTWLGASAHRMPQRLELGTAAARDLDTDDRWRVAFDPIRVGLALELQ